MSSRNTSSHTCGRWGHSQDSKSELGGSWHLTGSWPGRPCRRCDAVRCGAVCDGVWHGVVGSRRHHGGRRCGMMGVGMVRSGWWERRQMWEESQRSSISQCLLLCSETCFKSLHNLLYTFCYISIPIINYVIAKDTVSSILKYGYFKIERAPHSTKDPAESKSHRLWVLSKLFFGSLIFDQPRSPWSLHVPFTSMKMWYTFVLDRLLLTLFIVYIYVQLFLVLSHWHGCLEVGGLISYSLQHATGMSLGKSLTFSESHFSHLKIVIVPMPTALYFIKDNWGHTNIRKNRKWLVNSRLSYLISSLYKELTGSCCHPQGSSDRLLVHFAEYCDICVFNSILSTRTMLVCIKKRHMVPQNKTIMMTKKPV